MPVTQTASGPILLYDGLCGLCNRVVQFTLRHDPRERIRFAPLQGSRAAQVLLRHGLDPSQVDTVVLVLDPESPGERVLTRSDAVLQLMRELGGLWAWVAGSSRIVPRPVRDLLYRAIARTRYRIFGKYETCPLPTASQRVRFLDLPPC